VNIGILSRRPSLYSTTRLRQAAEQRGHQVQVVDYLRCYMDISAHRPAVMLRGVPLDFDAVVPRIGASNTFYGAAVVRQLEVLGVYTVNGSEAISRSRDKLWSLQLLASAGIKMPVTGFAHSTKDIDGLIDVVGGTPLIVKLVEGTQGIGVVLAETKKAAHSVIGAFLQLDANILVQQFVKESRGADVRAFVVGSEVIAAMKRQAAPGEFRANLHRGGRAVAVQLSDADKAVAVNAAQTLGLGVAGVDFLPSEHGPLVIEVNSSPGLEGIEGATGVDVAAAIVGYIEGNARPGERQPTLAVADTARKGRR
jgi:ribosomal protein S6--L-glutamate ligase